MFENIEKKRKREQADRAARRGAEWRESKCRMKKKRKKKRKEERADTCLTHNRQKKRG